MKLTLTRAVLLKAIEGPQRIIERKTTIPVLSNLLLAAGGERLTVTGTDLDIEIRTSCAAAVAKPGTLTVPGHLLHDIARKLPEGCEVTIEAQENERLTVKAGRSRFTLPTLPSQDYPDITVGEMTHEFAMEAKALATLISATEFAISTEETRYYLNGIYLHATEIHLVGVATDGHRLARQNAALPEGAAGLPGIIIPRKTVGEIGKIVDKTKGTVTLAVSAGKLRLTVEGDNPVTLTSKLIDGTYPDYQRVIPASNEKLATLDISELGAAVDRVSTISSERGRAVRMDLTQGQVTLSVTNPDTGEAREEVAADYDGPDLSIGFNARYLGDILGTLARDGTDTVLLKLNDSGSPTILQSRDGADLLTVLMPMRV